MSKRLADKLNKDAKQPKLGDFFKAKTKESEKTTGKTAVNVYINVNVNVKTRAGKKDAKIIHFISAVPEAQSSSSTNKTHAIATSSADFTEKTVNVTLNVNVGVETEEAGKSFFNILFFRFMNI